MKPAQIKRDLQHPSLLFHQPVKWHLISMLMRMVPSLLVRQHLYAVWLERSYNSVPIRVRSKSHIPMRVSLVAAPDLLSLSNLISYRNGNVLLHTHTHLCRSHIIRSTFSPSGFFFSFFSATNWKMKPLNQQVKPRLQSNQPDFLLPLLLQIRTWMHIGWCSGLASVNTLQTQTDIVKSNQMWCVPKCIPSQYCTLYEVWHNNRNT